MRRFAPVLVALAVIAVACEGGGGDLGTERPPGTDARRVAPAGSAIPVDDLHAPRGPRATARMLRRVERGLRAEASDPAKVQKHGQAQQLAYRQLAAHPEWVQEVLAAVPDDVRPAVQANVAAGEALSALTGEAPAGFPPWRIVAPPPPETLRSFYDEGAAASGIPWAYLAAIHLVETRMGRIQGTSTAGAQGPMQFIQSTWDAYGEGDINDNRDAILAAGRYLDASGGPENMDRALFAYNNDERYVAAVRAYAELMLADARAYDGYYHWQVFYRNIDGTFLLPEGYVSPSA
jgi:hypothetical protein